MSSVQVRDLCYEMFGCYDDLLFGLLCDMFNGVCDDSCVDVEVMLSRIRVCIDASEIGLFMHRVNTGFMLRKLLDSYVYCDDYIVGFSELCRLNSGRLNSGCDIYDYVCWLLEEPTRIDWSLVSDRVSVYRFMACMFYQLWRMRCVAFSSGCGMYSVEVNSHNSGKSLLFDVSLLGEYSCYKFGACQTERGESAIDELMRRLNHRFVSVCRNRVELREWVDGVIGGYEWGSCEGYRCVKVFKY